MGSATVPFGGGSVREAMRVTLSFDNGPTPGVTERVLDVLDGAGVLANFFVVGQKLLDPDARRATERTIAAGHVVGGHTWSHSVPFGRLDPAGIDRELEQTRRIVDDVGGDGLRFRPYGVGGAMDDRLMSVHGAARLRADGYTCVLWNSVPGDWLDADGWLDTAIADVTARDWSVVVLHDLPVGAAGQLGAFLTRLADSGSEFVTETPDDCTPIRNGRATESYGLLGVGEP